MKKYLIALLLVCSSYLTAASWHTAGSIPLNTSTGAQKDVTMAYYPKTKTVVAAWVNMLDSLPYYSVYNGTSWTLGLPFTGNTITANGNVNLQSFPKMQLIVAAWGGGVYQDAYYSIFDGVNWSVTNLIDPTAFSVIDEVNMTYDKLNNRIVAAWGATPSKHMFPYFATLPMAASPALLTWTPSAAIPGAIGFDEQVLDNVNLVYNKIDHQVIAIWVFPNFSSPSDQPTPLYTTWDVTTPTWSGIINSITIDPPGTGANENVRMATVPSSSNVLAVWGNFDASNPGAIRPAYVSGYAGTFANGDPLFNGGVPGCPFTVSTGGVLDDVSIAVTTIDEVFVAWTCQTGNVPVSGVVQLPSTIIFAGPIPSVGSAGAKANVNLKEDQASKRMIAAWVDMTSNALFYNTYN